MARIALLIQPNAQSPEHIRNFDPSLSPSQISWLRSGAVERFGSSALKRIENSILAGLAARSMSEAA
jgi:hypothetical protein